MIKLFLTRRKIIGDDVMRNVSMQNHFEAGERVVAEGSVAQVPVDLTQRRDLDVVIEHDGT